MQIDDGGEVDVLVVLAQRHLDRRGEDRLRQREPSTRPSGSSIPHTVPDARYSAQPRPGQVAAGDALHRHHVQPVDDHRAAPDAGGDIGADDVVADDIGELLEPPQRQLVEDGPLVGDRRRQHLVEGRDACPWPPSGCRRRASRRAGAPSRRGSAAGPGRSPVTALSLGTPALAQVQARAGDCSRTMQEASLGDSGTVPQPCKNRPRRSKRDRREPSPPAAGQLSDGSISPRW